MSVMVSFALKQKNEPRKGWVQKSGNTSPQKTGILFTSYQVLALPMQ